mmetsp:Transcript_20137/g.24837  ORF Transcript_20137/g.24837 Transcript_20137/m.24837 type:complete len:94 (+) Transcript_20137:1210-1491(+)
MLIQNLNADIFYLCHCVLFLHFLLVFFLLNRRFWLRMPVARFVISKFTQMVLFANLAFLWLHNFSFTSYFSAMGLLHNVVDEKYAEAIQATLE